MTLGNLESFSLIAIRAFKEQSLYLAERSKEGAKVNEAQRELLICYSVARSIFHYATGFNQQIEQSDVESACYWLMDRLRFTTSLNYTSNTNQTDRVTLGWL